jgi:sporulation protein YlmC with PRC-barrel domain
LSIGRLQLLNKKVYTQDAEYVGTVVDIGFTIGEGKPILVVDKGDGKAIEIAWSNVAAAKDIVLLVGEFDPSQAKEAKIKSQEDTVEKVTQTETVKTGIFSGLTRGGKGVTCPTCGKQAKYISQYNRWYCYKCGKYV